MTLGERIRAAIQARGLKDVWVADGAGITTTTLSNIIRGRTADPSVSVVSAIADVLHESVDALLGRPAAHSLLKHEQEMLRGAATLITNRVLPPPNEEHVTTHAVPRRRRKKRKMVPVADVAASPERQIFATNVRELPKREIPRELRESGIERIFRVDGDSMTGANIEHGDILYVRTGVTREQANGRIVVCRHGDDEAVKRLRVVDGQVRLESENPKYAPVLLTGEQANELEVYGIVAGRYTPV
jgi:phage repressor protein C with HTH and peptisase S24 domain